VPAPRGRSIVRTSLASGLLAVALLAAGPAAQQPPATPAPPQPPTFRVGVGAVRVDVTVIGRNGLPVTDLTRDDFEVREDSVVQRVQLFQHVSLSGQPPAGSDESLAIRSTDHARQEAARDDVRLLVIFIDDYHLKFGAIADTRLRRDLVNFIQAEMRPLDLFAVMGPLTPISDLGLTRDRNSLLERVNHVQGRLGGFVPPRSPIEEAHMRLGGGDLTRIRAQVSLSALESLAVHLGGLREGRKSILYVSQGPPMLRGGADLTGALRDVIVAANRNNVTIHTLDPRQLGEARLISDSNAALSSDTGGRRIGLTNDFTRPLQGVMADASAYYLLGYESPATAADGKFRKIDVDVRRGGVRVIARTGYWAPRPEDLRTSAKASSEPAVPPEVAEALDSLKDQLRRIAVADWIGVRPLDSGQSQVTVVFETLAARAAPRVGVVELEVTGPDGVKSNPTPLEEPAGVWAVRFEAPPGRLRTRATVRNTAGEEIDSWSHDTIVPLATDGSLVGTPIVYRPASVLQYRALMAGTEIAPSAVRRFRRTDRAVVRLAMAAHLKAPVDVQLLNRQGVPLKTMAAAAAPAPAEVQVELPLGSLAFADYVLRFTVTLSGGKTTRLVPFTLAP
jgi:VWFA-related protein